jgi:hypothetical protein
MQIMRGGNKYNEAPAPKGIIRNIGGKNNKDAMERFLSVRGNAYGNIGEITNNC